MRINEILSENQISELDEGVWDAVKAGAGKVGRGLGAVGQAVGAVAGVPAGIAGAVKRGYNSSAQNIVGGPRVDTSVPAQQMQGGQQAQGVQQAQPTQGVQQGQSARPTPMNFNQLTQAVRKAQLTPNQKTQLAQQITGGAANTPAAPPGPAQGQGSSTLGATPAQKQAAALANATTTARGQMTPKPTVQGPAAGSMSGWQGTGNGSATGPASALGAQGGQPTPAEKRSAAADAAQAQMTPKPASTSVPTQSGAGTAAPVQAPTSVSPGAAPIVSPTDMAAKAAGKATDASGKQIPALVRRAAQESVEFHSKFLGRML